MTGLEVLGVFLLVLEGIGSLYWIFYISLTVVEQGKNIEELQDSWLKLWDEQVNIKNKLAEKQDKKKVKS